MHCLLFYNQFEFFPPILADQKKDICCLKLNEPGYHSQFYLKVLVLFSLSNNKADWKNPISALLCLRASLKSWVHLTTLPVRVENMVIGQFEDFQQKIELPQLESSTFFQKFTSLNCISAFTLVRRGFNFTQLFRLACRQDSTEIVLFSICTFITQADQPNQHYESEKELRGK